MPADAADGREHSQAEAPSSSDAQASAARAARANLQRLPVIASGTDAVPSRDASDGSGTTLDQIFASEKKALNIESQRDERTQRQADRASSRLVEALEQQAAQAQGAERPATRQAAAQALDAQAANGGSEARAANGGAEAQTSRREPKAQAAGREPEVQAANKEPEKPATQDMSAAVTAPLPADARGAGTIQKDRKRRAPSSGKESSAKKPRKRFGRTVIIVLVAILCVYLLGFSWNQWMRGDDEIDIQGVWQIAGTENTVTITQDYIQLTPDVKYPYTVDTAAKTITFTFADLSGTGRYRFSIDRNQLAIIEGPDFSAIGNTFSDIFWFGRSFFWYVFTQEVVNPGVETTEQRNQKEAAKQAEIDQEKAQEAQEAQEAQKTEEVEIEAASSSDYVLGSQLIKKTQAIKGIKSTTKKEEGTIDLPTECTLLIRTDQPVDIPSNEKPVMTIELHDSTQGEQSDARSEGAQGSKPLIVEVPTPSTSGQSPGSASGSSAAGDAAEGQSSESSGQSG